MNVFAWAVGLLCAYILGAVPTGLLFGKTFAGVDIREHGSKNIGFTNALRVLGPRLGIPVLLIDVGKAFAAVTVIPSLALADPGTVFPVLAGAGALLGNMFNVFLGLRGGKGVATAFGVFLGLALWPTLSALAAFLIILAVTRYVSLGSVIAALVLPSAAVVQSGFGPLFVLTALTAAGVIVKHRSNVRRLLEGTESRLGAKGGVKSPEGPDAP